MEETTAMVRDERGLRIELPAEPPELTLGAARALSRLLLKAARDRPDTVMSTAPEPKALAS